MEKLVNRGVGIAAETVGIHLGFVEVVGEDLICTLLGGRYRRWIEAVSLEFITPGRA